MTLNKKLKILIIVSAIAFGTFGLWQLYSLHEHDPKLVGQWSDICVTLNEGKGCDYGVYPQEIFYPDGTYRTRLSHIGSKDEGMDLGEGTWSTSDNKLEIHLEKNISTYKYSYYTRHTEREDLIQVTLEELERKEYDSTGYAKIASKNQLPSKPEIMVRLNKIEK